MTELRVMLVGLERAEHGLDLPPPCDDEDFADWHEHNQEREACAADVQRAVRLACTMVQRTHKGRLATEIYALLLQASELLDHAEVRYV